jgi:hypothetical protein
MDVSKLTSRFKRKEKPPGDAAAPAAKAGAAAKLPFMRREPKLESTPPGGEAAAKIKPVRVPKDPSKRIKKMGLLKSSKGQKFILLIGDEGAILVYLKDNAVQSRHFVPDASPQNLEELQQAFAVDTKAPLIIVIDTMDQSFVQQTLPPSARSASTSSSSAGSTAISALTTLRAPWCWAGKRAAGKTGTS